MSRFVVIGGANVDLMGTAAQPLRPQDSNPGTIRTALGGVGRNIAENLARLNEVVSLVSVVGDDPFGRWILDQGKRCGIEMSGVKIAAGERTSAFLAILDDRHDLAGAIADMAILRQLDFAFLQSVIASLRPDDLLIWDTNLEPELIRWIADHAPCPLAMDPLSASKSEKARPVLSRLAYFKPNRAEAQRLCGFAIKTEDDIRAALDWFAAQGVGEIVLSLGAQGTAIAAGESRLMLHLDPLTPVNTTGAGDCFFAVYLSQRRRGCSVKQAAQSAAAGAALTLSDPESVSPELTLSALKRWQSRITFRWTDLTPVELLSK